jgi:hypothetical protein
MWYSNKQWKEEIDNNKIIVAEFLDLKRDFETIDLNILMQKLFCYGITENEYDWFKSYLDQQFQKTGFNGVLSAFGNNEGGTGCVPRLNSRSGFVCVIYQQHCNDCNTSFNNQTVC